MTTDDDNNEVEFTLNATSGPEHTPLVITGKHFGAGIGTLALNEVPAPALTWTDHEITTIVPYGATTGDLVVTTADGRSAAVAFTVTPGRWTPEGPVDTEQK